MESFVLEKNLTWKRTEKSRSMWSKLGGCAGLQVADVSSQTYSDVFPLTAAGAPGDPASKPQVGESPCWRGRCSGQVRVGCAGPCRCPDPPPPPATRAPRQVGSHGHHTICAGVSDPPRLGSEGWGLWGVHDYVPVVFLLATGASKKASQRFAWSHSTSHQAAFRSIWWFSFSQCCL